MHIVAFSPSCLTTLSFHSLRYPKQATIYKCIFNGCLAYTHVKPFNPPPHSTQHKAGYRYGPVKSGYSLPVFHQWDLYMASNWGSSSSDVHPGSSRFKIFASVVSLKSKALATVWLSAFCICAYKNKNNNYEVLYCSQIITVELRLSRLLCPKQLTEVSG